MVERDRDHPSVIFWSASNETDETRPEVAAGNAELVRLAKSLEPTRLATHVSNHWDGEPHFDDDDVVCVNGYPSWDGRIWQKNPGYDLSQSGRWWQESLAELNSRYPDKPILISEFGYPCLDGVVEGALGEEVQASVIRSEFEGMQAPYVCGTTVWCWADHPWPEEDFVAYVTTSPFGVVTRTRRRKAAFETARELFGGKPFLPDWLASADAGPGEFWVNMIRPTMESIPHFDFPDGYSIRPMRPGESGLWVDIQQEAEPVLRVTDDVFESEFGGDLPATRYRSFFIVNEAGVAVGTISAWYSRDFKGEDHGRIHWLAIRPAFQGRGLARPALSFAMERLAEWHDRAWLSTSTSRIPALKLYLDFGFLPDMEEPRAREAWQKVLARLKHPALEAALREG